MRSIKAMICAWLLCFGLSLAYAAVEVNLASSDDLESIKGIGPSTAQRILQQRRTAPFRDWKDLISRVPGIGDKRAARLSEQGLRVQGKAFGSMPPSRSVSSQPIGYAPRIQPPLDASRHDR